MPNPAAYGYSKQLTVGTPTGEFPFDREITGFCAVVTVAGNAVITLTGGTQMTIALPVGTTVLNLAVIEVNSQTATGTYYALAE